MQILQEAYIEWGRLDGATDMTKQKLQTLELLESNTPANTESTRIKKLEQGSIGIRKGIEVMWGRI